MNNSVDLRIFEQRDLVDAYAHSATGGQSLHLMDGAYGNMQSRTPNCFKNRRQIAHLFDQNRERLVSTAKRLGVRVILVEREGTPKQHIDLCGKPLERAEAEAKQHARLRIAGVGTTELFHFEETL